MSAILVVLVLLSAPVQAAITTALFRDPLAAPVLPVALIAGWAVMRNAEETWPALFLPAILLGAASEERMGWFLIALLPAPALAAAGVARIRPRVTGITRRLVIAGSVAALAALAYATVLSAAGGVLGHLGASAGGLLVAAAGSALLAMLAALAFWPLRPRERGLFT